MEGGSESVQSSQDAERFSWAAARQPALARGHASMAGRSPALPPRPTSACLPHRLLPPHLTPPPRLAYVHADGQLQNGRALGPKVVLDKVAVGLEAASAGIPEGSVQSREQ